MKRDTYTLKLVRQDGTMTLQSGANKTQAEGLGQALALKDEFKAVMISLNGGRDRWIKGLNTI